MASQFVSLRDQLVAEAQSLNHLIDLAERFDPALGQSLQPQALAAAKTPWGVLGSFALAWVVSHYGIGLDDTTVSLIAGLAVLAASYLGRWLERHPIEGLLHRRAEAAVKVVQALAVPPAVPPAISPAIIIAPAPEPAPAASPLPTRRAVAPELLMLPPIGAAPDDPRFPLQPPPFGTS